MTRGNRRGSRSCARAGESTGAWPLASEKSNSPEAGQRGPVGAEKEGRLNGVALRLLEGQRAEARVVQRPLGHRLLNAERHLVRDLLDAHRVRCVPHCGLDEALGVEDGVEAAVSLRAPPAKCALSSAGKQLGRPPRRARRLCRGGTMSSSRGWQRTQQRPSPRLPDGGAPQCPAQSELS
jgi:hypothetical protein